MISEYDVGGVQWWVVSREFPSELAARGAWAALEAEGRRRKGKLSLGVYRHGPPEQGGFRFVTAVGHDAAGIAFADRMLERGDDYDLPIDFAEAMILRRARVVVGLLEEGAGPGTYAIKRGRRGARLLPDGTMLEPIGGDE